MSRIPSSRARQTSTNSVLQDALRNRPSSAASNNKITNGERANTPELKEVASVPGRTVAEPQSTLKEPFNLGDFTRIMEEDDNLMAELMESIYPRDVNLLKREETEPAEGTDHAAMQLDNDKLLTTTTPVSSLPPTTTTRSRAASRPSKPATPIIGPFSDPAAAAAVPLSRSRSARATLNNSSTSASWPPLPPAPMSPRRSHKKGATAVALARDTIADLTISPSLHSPASSVSEANYPPSAPVPIQRRPARPRNGHANNSNGNGNDNIERHHHRAASEADVDGGAPSEADPNEPKYCVCDGVSYGEMVACDNEACPREWFHLDCVGLSRAPTGKAKWFCEECKEEMRSRAGRNGGVVVVGNGWGGR